MGTRIFLGCSKDGSSTLPICFRQIALLASAARICRERRKTFMDRKQLENGQLATGKNQKSGVMKWRIHIEKGKQRDYFLIMLKWYVPILSAAPVGVMPVSITR